MPNQKIEVRLNEYGLELTPIKTKPWGFTLGVQQNSVQKFIDIFFPGFQLSSEFLSPRFIVVNPNSRLSWQKHNRRSELWKVIQGPVGVITSKTDKQSNRPEKKVTGSIVQIEPNMRHRLVGLRKAGIIAETWVHLDINKPSDANDIVRLDDDYKR